MVHEWQMKATQLSTGCIITTHALNTANWHQEVTQGRRFERRRLLQEGFRESELPRRRSCTYGSQSNGPCGESGTAREGGIAITAFGYLRPRPTETQVTAGRETPYDSDWP